MIVPAAPGKVAMSKVPKLLRSWIALVLAAGLGALVGWFAFLLWLFSVGVSGWQWGRDPAGLIDDTASELVIGGAFAGAVIMLLYLGSSYLLRQRDKRHAP